MPDSTAAADVDEAKPSLPSVTELLAEAVQALKGAPRHGQQLMTESVTQAIDDRSVLIVQAGTGTGKSLAYLVPAARHAVASGGRVLISTATLALQSQVVNRDLPRLAQALKPALGREVTFAMVKGRGNYVCRHKLAGGMPDDEESLFDLDPLPGRVLTTGPATTLGQEVVRVRKWASETSTGDRDDLVPGVGERAWRQVSVSARECLGGSQCPMAHDCFSENTRARAHFVDIVVTNHALLTIDTFEGRSILPPHDALVVDEAHELADRVTAVVSDELTVGQIEAAAGMTRRQAGVDVADLLDAADALGGALETAVAGRFATGLPAPLAAALARVRDTTRACLSELKSVASQRRGGEASAGLQVVRAGLSDVFDTVERLLEDRDSDVSWLSVIQLRSGTRRTLTVAPLSVASRLRERLYDGRAVVLTSATLTVGGGFQAVARSVGLEHEKAPAYDSLDVGSPFDYGRQAILYMARSLPPPGREGPTPQAMDELAGLIEAAGGRTLGLFSSRRGAELAAEAMRERLALPVLCQGDDAMPTLVKRFADEQASCLFGTLSLWQGVDVPGPSCQLVVIDRIPFPRPDDPLLSARAEAIAKAGGNGFMTVSVTHAGLRLAQGAGRLIRSMDDRGVVAVLDSRLATARYGSVLLASLPPMWRTTDRAVVLAALTRLDAAGRA